MAPRDPSIPKYFLLSQYLQRKWSITSFQQHIQDFYSRHFCAERIGLQTTVFREVNDHAIWRQRSVVATDNRSFFWDFTLTDGFKKERQLHAGVGAVEVRNRLNDKSNKAFVITRLKVSFRGWFNVCSRAAVWICLCLGWL